MSRLNVRVLAGRAAGDGWLLLAIALWIALPGESRAEPATGPSVESAVAELQQGDLYQALSQLKQLVESDPELAEPHFYLAVLYSRIGQHDLALDFAGRALELDGQNTAFHNLEGAILVEQRRFQQALESFEKALAGPQVKEPEKVWRNLGFVHLELNDRDRALEAFRKVRELVPDDTRAALALGKLYLERGDVDAALAELDVAIRYSADRPAAERAAAHAQRGAALQRAGRLDEAVAGLERAVALAPEDLQAHYNLAQALLRQGRREDGQRRLAEYERLRAQAAELEHLRLERTTTFQSAVDALQKGRLEAGEKGLRQVLDEEPAFGPAHLSLGYLLLQKQDYAAAIHSLEQALALEPLNAGAYFYLAAAREALGDPRAALEPAERAVAIHGENAEHHRLLGQIYLALDRPDEARQSLERAVALDPSAIATRLRLGLLELAQDRPRAALEHLRQAVAADATHREALWALSRVESTLGNYEESIEQLRRLVALDPTEVEPHLALAELLARTRRYDEAERVFAEALTAVPDRRRVHAARGALARSRGRLEDAAADFEHAARLGEGETGVEILVELAPIYVQQGRIDDAIDAYRELLEHRPESLDARGGLAELYLQRHEIEPAEAELRALLELDPGNARARAQLARTHLEAGRLEPAIATARAALDELPDHLQARYTLATALLRAGRAEEGRRELEHYRRLLESSQDLEHSFRELMALNQEALVELEKGRPQEAVALFRQAAERFPGMALPQVNLALALIKAGDGTAAIEHLKRAVELGFDVPEVHRYLAEQYEALGRVEEGRHARDNYRRLRAELRRRVREETRGKLSAGDAPAGEDGGR